MKPAVTSILLFALSPLLSIGLAACAEPDAAELQDVAETSHLLGDEETLVARDFLALDQVQSIARASGVELTRVTYVDLVPYDVEGAGHFTLVWGLTEVLGDGTLLETYIDPQSGDLLGQEAPHAGLLARIRELGADKTTPDGSSPDTYESFPWGWQLPYINGTGYMTQGYNRGTHTGSLYYSTDWDPGNCGHPVYAPSSGWVMDNASRGGWGYNLVVSGACASGTCSTGGGGYRYIWRLAHFQSTPVVKPGWWVAKNQLVGYMGTTGTSTACHIHYMAYRGTYAGSGNVSGETVPINKWPGSSDSICGGKLAGYNFSDATMDTVKTGSSGCP